MSEYKPGAVAMATVRGHRGMRVMRTSGSGGSDTCWSTVEFADGTRYHRQEHVIDVRPLVVLDPENREEVAHLLQAYGDQYSDWTPDPDGPNVDRLQEALRSLTGVPRPPEPQGLGAVVANVKGHKFVRVADVADGWMHDRQWQRIGGDLNAVRNFGWDHIKAVEVLSEGLS